MFKVIIDITNIHKASGRTVGGSMSFTTVKTKKEVREFLAINGLKRNRLKRVTETNFFISKVVGRIRKLSKGE